MNASLTRKRFTARAVAWFGLMPALAATVAFSTPSWAQEKPDVRNPSQEYLSGGPTKVEFLCHRDTTRVAAPCILNYWRSSHYGGAVVAVGAGERWAKVIGPFFLYLNSGGDPQALWKDAIAQATRERTQWPYDWVAGVDYPHRKERATVKGQLVLDDPQMPTVRLVNLRVGLTHPAYTPPTTHMGMPRPIDWQTDAKHYQFWVRGDERGNFSIPQVRAGQYTLHAFADGVLGEYAKADVTVEPSASIDLGRLTWTPVRRGMQLWDIGIPNRNGSEFFKGDAYADPEIALQYAKLFPNDVNYIIGQSDFRKDWFFQHVPHNEDPAARAVHLQAFAGADGPPRLPSGSTCRTRRAARRRCASLSVANGTSLRAYR